MNTLDELNRIKLANTIINRASNRLGVRPLYVGEMIQAERKARNADMQIVAAKLSQEKLLRKQKTFQKLLPKKPITMLLSVAVFAALYFLIFVFNGSGSKPLVKTAKAIESSQQKSSIFDNSSKSMIITSGIFKNLDEAKNYQQELSKRLGMDLKILHDGSYYTVQIGPNYDNREDAMLVYDEISRFSVPNLALRY